MLVPQMVRLTGSRLATHLEQQTKALVRLLVPQTVQPMASRLATQLEQQTQASAQLSVSRMVPPMARTLGNLSARRMGQPWEQKNRRPSTMRMMASRAAAPADCTQMHPKC